MNVWFGIKRFFWCDNLHRLCCLSLNCKVVVINKIISKCFVCVCVYALYEHHTRLHGSGIEPLTLWNRPFCQLRPRLRLRHGSQLSHWLFLALIPAVGVACGCSLLVSSNMDPMRGEMRLWPLYVVNSFLDNIDVKRATALRHTVPFQLFNNLFEMSGKKYNLGSVYISLYFLCVNASYNYYP